MAAKVVGVHDDNVGFGSAVSADGYQKKEKQNADGRKLHYA